MAEARFHLAFPVRNLAAAKKFYLALGCKAGRESKHSLILQLGGHQIVAQLSDCEPRAQRGIYPRHFGLIFSSLAEWKRLLARARRNKLKFYQEPKVRFPGTPVEHHTFFLQDPSGNLLEFKHYRSPAAIFGRRAIRRVGDRG
ncbi:MAG: VOC family protein [Deltaproteobacteria bacterium]|nr:VOC family protein [Deltaproteobacteria bacterium]